MPVMMDPDATFADLVARAPATAAVFQRYGIDFCCQGRHSLRVACRSAGVDLEGVLAALAAAATAPTAAKDWKDASLASLARHISMMYHAPLLEQLPHLHQLLDSVEQEHAHRWPELIPPLAGLVRALMQEISFHTNEEEDRLFPAIAAIERCEAVELHGRTLDRFLERLEDEHFLTGRMLKRLELLTDGFTPPDRSSPRLVALYVALEALSVTHKVHVHLENHVLFPRAAALGRARADGEPC